MASSPVILGRLEHLGVLLPLCVQGDKIFKAELIPKPFKSSHEIETERTLSYLLYETKGTLVSNLQKDSRETELQTKLIYIKRCKNMSPAFPYGIKEHIK